MPSNAAARAGTPQFVRLSAQASTAELRTEVYKGAEHVVIPVVALVGDVVVRGMNSSAPEFVPSDVLAAAPAGLDGRPVVNVHPANGQEGANTPGRWEDEVFGQCFSSHFSNGALQTEVWLSREQAERVGADAVEVIERALAHEMFEVSIGAWVWLENEEGVAPNGQRYSQRWQAAVYDHLACGLQAQGGVGACSNEMGCGGPRVLATGVGPRVLSAKQAEAIKDKEYDMPATALATVYAKLGKDQFSALAEGMSDNELRRKLNKALRATVPAFWGVEEVFMDSSTAIYLAMPGDSLEFWECAFSVDGDNVTLGRKKRVEPVTRWEKVAAGANEIATSGQLSVVQPSANCSCQNHDNASPNAGDGAAAPTGTKGASMSDKAKELGTSAARVKELVGRLVANAATKLTDADVPALSAFSEEQLTAMVALVEKPAEVKEVQVPAPADPNLVTFTADEATEMRSALAERQKREKLRRSALVKALTDAGVKYTEAQLNAKTTDDLETLADTLGLFEGGASDASVPDFAGRGLHAALRANDESVQVSAAAPPDPWKLDASVSKPLGYKQAS